MNVATGLGHLDLAVGIYKTIAQHLFHFGQLTELNDRPTDTVRPKFSC